VDGFKVYVDANEHECKREGQEVAVLKEFPGFSISGILICPPYKVVCQVGVLLLCLHFRYKLQGYSHLPSIETLVSLHLYDQN